jgi:CheY-like chemotaxis protein
MPSPPFLLHALIIEDHEDLAQLFAALFEAIGCTCDLAGNGNVGLEIARKNIPHLIFSDLYMPAKDGFDVAREIRSDQRFNATWLIAVTASNDPANEQKARAAGFDRIYRKPIKFAQLTELVNDYNKYPASSQ